MDYGNIFVFFGFINYMMGNNFVIGFVSGVFVGVNYHKVLKPYTTMVEEETRKKFEEYQEFYRKINDYNKDNKDSK